MFFLKLQLSQPFSRYISPLFIAACSLLLTTAACKKDSHHERQNITVDAKNISFTTNSRGEPRGLSAWFNWSGRDYYVTADIGPEILTEYPGSISIANLDFVADNSTIIPSFGSEVCAIRNPAVPNSIRYNLDDDPLGSVYTANSEFASVLVNITPATEFYFGGRTLYETYDLKQMDSACLAATKQIAALYPMVHIMKH